MTQKEDLTAREAEIIRTLRALYSESSSSFVLIGGYATSALATHRFSIDCDIVIAEKERKFFDKLLYREGYKVTKQSSTRGGAYEAKSAKYLKLVNGRSVSVDVSINSVMCRDTGGEWSYALLQQNSVEANIVGIASSARALIPKRELLIAVKLHPARDTDLKDIVILSEGADWNAVTEFTNTGDRRKLLIQLDSSVKRIQSKEFFSAFKADFGFRTDMAPIVNEALEQLISLRKNICLVPGR